MIWTEAIDEAVESKHLLKHDFYKAWTAGELSIDALRGYAGQYYKHVAAFPRYLTAIHTQTEDIRARQHLLDNLIDEERGDENHPELWLRFAEGIGCERDEIRSAAPLPHTSACDATYREITGARGPFAGMAALYAYESMVPAVAQSKIEGLKQYYDVSDERSLSFFTVHLEVDEWHADVARNLLASAPDEVRDDSVRAAGDALDALNHLLNGVVEAFC